MTEVDAIENLGAESRALVESYLAEVSACLAGVDPDLAAETIDNVRGHLVDRLPPAFDAEDVARVLAELGPPESLTAALRSEPQEASGSFAGSGTILGVPFDLRPPTAQRIASRWWNPGDPRLLMPRAFGIGWDLNFGALAVRLRLIEPDAEDEPFAQVPDRAFLLALLVPVAMTATTLGSYLALRAELPAELPVHWDWKGEADRWAPAMSAYLPLLLGSVASCVWAVWSTAAHRTPISRAASIGLATLVSGLAAFTWLLTVVEVLGASIPGWAFPAGICVVLLIVLVQLTALARVGRASEIQRDLALTARTERGGEEL